MPYYDFVCRNCDNQFDRAVPVAKRDEVFCHLCGSKATRLFSTPTFKITQEYVRKYPESGGSSAHIQPRSEFEG